MRNHPLSIEKATPMSDTYSNSGDTVDNQSGQSDQQMNPVDMIRDRLAGRGPLAIALGLLTGIIAATVCWIVIPERFESTGIIEVDAQRAVVMARLPEENEGSKTFGMYLQNQMNLVKSEDVLNAAIESETLRNLRLTRSGAALIKSIEQNLTVMIPRNSWQLQVRYSDVDQLAAMEVTNAIMESYIQIHGNVAGSEIAETTRNIRLEEQENRRRVQTKQEQRQELIRRSKDGMGDVSGLISSLSESRQAMLAKLEVYEETVRKLEKKEQDAGRSVAEMTGKEMPIPTDEELMVFDPRLVLITEEIANDRITLDKIRPRLKDTHRLVKKLMSGIESQEANKKIAIEETRERWYEGPGKKVSYGKLNEEIKKMEDRLVVKRERMQQLHNHQQSYETLSTDLELLESDFQSLQDRLQSIEREAPFIGDRIQIVQNATESTPAKSKRIQIAGGAFFGGLFGVIGVFFLIGTVDQRAFALRQLKTDRGKFHCLGVIPDTTKSSDDPDILNIAMNCVHRLRNKIESIRLRLTGGYVALVSSPFQGDGKTTLVTLLGHSYAAAGFKTCLVDCDFIGRSLSHHFEKLSDEGLKEVISGASLSESVVPLDAENLYLLSIGIDERVNAERMQVGVVTDLLAKLRAEFDFVIIDTGPLSGSIESTPIASNVDGVLLALRKGRSRIPLRRCVRDLHELNAPYLGVVLNYADKSDYREVASVSKSIDQVIKEESSGVRQKNALAESLKRGNQGTRN